MAVIPEIIGTTNINMADLPVGKVEITLEPFNLRLFNGERI
jgi:hypothetical protein